MVPRWLPVVALVAISACNRGSWCDGGRAVRGAQRVTGALDEGTPRDGGTLCVHVNTEPPTLNPLIEHDYWTSWIALGPIYEPLVRQDPLTGQVLPSLATAWSESGLTLRFTLRPGVRWHDGRPLSPQDVVETFQRVREPGASPDAKQSLAALRTVDVAAAAVPGAPPELVFTFSAPSPLALQAIARIPILPAHLFGPGDLRLRPASRAPVGTGPFRFVEWRPATHIRLERNTDYWGPRPHLDRVELRIVRDGEVAWELARRGELDLLWQLTPGQADRAPTDEKLAGFRMVPWFLPRYSFVLWNTAVPPLGDVRVRRALAHLVDRDGYLRTAYRGRARVVTGPYLPGSEAYDASIAPWPFDPARAAALLDEAGLRDTNGDGIRELPGGKPFHLAFLITSGSVTQEALATTMQRDFARAGVQLDIVPIEWAQQLDRLRKHAFEVSVLVWTDIKRVQDNTRYFLSSQAAGGENYGSWDNPEADRLLAELATAMPGPSRAALDHRMHRLVYDEQPYTFLCSSEVDSLLAPRVHGYHPDADGPGFSRLWVDDGAGHPPAPQQADEKKR